jgi:geranylgeranyl diphosphate synthase type 3
MMYDINSGDENHVLEPFNYLLTIPGKGMRNIFIAAFEKWIQVPPQHKIHIQEIISMLHNSSLL